MSFSTSGCGKIYKKITSNTISEHVQLLRNYKRAALLCLIKMVNWNLKLGTASEYMDSVTAPIYFDASK